MMGDQGEEQMHTVIGKQRSGCNNGASYSNMMKGGAFKMMGWDMGI